MWTPGAFTATPGIMAGLKETKIDQGAFYASKDFYDPVKKRRINWGWAQVHPASVQSLPREVTWHPELQQLVFSPVEEQDTLRGRTIGRLAKTTLSPGKHASLGLPKRAGNTSEVVVSFDRPAAAVQLSVNVMVGSAPGLAKWEADWNLGGADYEVNSTESLTVDCVADGKCPCQARCEADGKERCKSWTLVPPGAPSRAGAPRCCLKSSVPASSPYPGIFSGVNDPDAAAVGGTLFTVDYVHDPTKVSAVKVHGGGHTDTLQLLPSDTTIDVRLYVDNRMTEAFWMGGRVAMTVDTPATEAADIVVSIDGDAASAVPATATAWAVSPIWVSPVEVLQTPRMDGRPFDAWKDLV